MRRLIINADDLGINAQRSHGIFQCMEFGVATSTTILATGSDSDHAARHARERNVPAGLHLNFTEEYPLSKQAEVSSVTESNGAFMSREKFRAALDNGEVQHEHLEREIRAQIEWCFDTYGAPTHIDGHHHIHIHPMIVNALLPACERYGIRFVRIPCEEPLPPFGYDVSPEQLERTQKINEQARTARELYAANGLVSTDHFRGLTLVGNASLKNLRHVIGRLPEGTTELMVHPGSQTTYGMPFDLDPQRQTEFRMLLDPSILELLDEKKVQCCSFLDL